MRNSVSKLYFTGSSKFILETDNWEMTEWRELSFPILFLLIFSLSPITNYSLHHHFATLFQNRLRNFNGLNFTNFSKPHKLEWNISWRTNLLLRITAPLGLQAIHIQQPLTAEMLAVITRRLPKLFPKRSCAIIFILYEDSYTQIPQYQNDFSPTYVRNCIL